MEAAYQPVPASDIFCVPLSVTSSYTKDKGWGSFTATALVEGHRPLRKKAINAVLLLGQV